MLPLKKINDKIVDQNGSLQVLIENWKKLGERIVFTNGVFDILHYGHLHYLAEAASLGTKLIIGVNADQSVKQLKGSSRPIHQQNIRLFQLSSLMVVDAVVLFEELTPLNLINTVKPHVLVKGGDYNIDNIVGAQEVLNDGGTVEIIKFQEGYSSSKIINLLRDF